MKTTKELIELWTAVLMCQSDSPRVTKDVKQAFNEIALSARNERDKEICICAAWKTTDGTIIRGHRHCSCLWQMQDMGLKPDEGLDAEGFITSYNRFVDRVEGLRLQKAAGQKFHKEARILFSEDLY